MNVSYVKDEVLRNEALQQYEVLNSISDAVLDDIVQLAASICGAPLAAISFLGAGRLWLKSRFGTMLHELRTVAFDIEHYALYLQYQRHRHPGGGMDQDSREQYQHFLLHSNVSTDLYEFREAAELRAVSLVDRLVDGLSSVYTFFDPEPPAASYGTYSILWQVQRCLELGLPYLYLGYWIRESAKMAYKASFRPIEGLVGGKWASM